MPLDNAEEVDRICAPQQSAGLFHFFFYGKVRNEGAGALVTSRWEKNIFILSA